MKNSKIFLYAVLISSFVPIIASAEDAFAALQFLVGNWEAEPSPAVTVAKTDFALDLQGKAIVRHNHAEYPPAAGKPGYTHDDLLVVYREVKPAATKGLYLDSAGYYARYTVTSMGPGQAVFVSDVIPGFPRYRTTYALLPDGRLSTTIEVFAGRKGECLRAVSAMDFEACRRECVQSERRAKAVAALSRSEACLPALRRTLRWENPIQPIRPSVGGIVRARIRG